MGVLDVLSGAATVLGKGFEGYGVDRQIRVKEALAQRQAEREAERDRVLNALTQRQIAEPRLGEPEYARAMGDVAGAQASARVPAEIAQATALAPLKESTQNPRVGSPEWKDAERFKAGLNPREPRQVSPVRWETKMPGIDDDWEPYQVNPETGETRPLRPMGSGGPAGPVTGMAGARRGVVAAVSRNPIRPVAPTVDAPATASPQQQAWDEAAAVLRTQGKAPESVIGPRP